MKDKVLNGVVIGLGIMGGNHARVVGVLDKVNLLGVFDSDLKRRKKIAELNHCEGFSSVDEVIGAKPDFAIVATPTPTHAEIGGMLVERGIPTFVEKPIARTMEEAEQMMSLADERRVPLMVGHIERYNPVIIKLKELLDEGYLGEVHKIGVRRVGPYPPRIGGSVAVDLAVHDLDIVRHVTGSPIVRVDANGKSVLGTGEYDMIEILAETKGGTVANLSFDWISPRKVRELTLVGEKGMFMVDYMAQTLVFYGNPGELKSATYAQILRGVDSTDYKGFAIRRSEPLRNELDFFANRVVRNGERPSPTAREAYEALHWASEAQRGIPS